jgi:hypothetical protein
MADKKIDEKQFLKQLSEEIHKPALKKFPTRKIFVDGKDNTWAMDLADMSTWKAETGYTYIMTLVDVFTRWAAARPLKTKGASEVLAAFKSIIEERGTYPKKLWVDEGTEFLNKEMKAFCTKHSIIIYHTWGQGKSVIVERFNRTLKTNMWKQLTAMNSHDWPPLVPELLKKYNEHKHATLGMSPNMASKHPNDAQQVWDRLLDSRSLVRSTRFKIGDWVRISRIKGKFEKGYDANWSQEIFKVAGVDQNDPPMYTLKDWSGEAEIKGRFYDQELQKTKLEDVFLVEKELKHRTKNGKKEVYVKWLGYPESANSWIPA